MSDPQILVPVGSHLFAPGALEKLVTAAIAEHPSKSNVLKAGLDSNGVQVVLGMSGKAGSDGNVQWTVHTAFTHDWTQGNTFGLGGSVAW